MAESLKVLRRRVRSVRNTRQITRAMEMVAAAKLRRAQQILSAGRPYARKLQELLGHLAEGQSTAGNPLFEQREAKNILLVLFTSDRGLCGAFNNHLIRLAEEFLKSYSPDKVRLICVGKKGYDYFKKRRWEIVDQITNLGGSLKAEESNALAEKLREVFLSRRADEIHILYNSFISTVRYRPVRELFLPLRPEALLGQKQTQVEVKKETLDYIFEPSPRRVFDLLLPRYLNSKIYITFAEEFAAEHSARMIAMNSATNNCEELMDQLTLRLNKARQSSITRELLDIVGGAEALRD
ncbi:MAG: ATP synthase F1 subunit gamma [bacterium]